MVLIELAYKSSVKVGKLIFKGLQGKSFYYLKSKTNIHNL